ncbi:glycoside hydrolase family 32 protein [Paenibacillus sp. LPE1-1-1.1]|uniref:glycoside hydrolase family 32 protein n=1 Tax=Paenibacillus sp. LPE1-1-1.1 TaxID=3135230 RepID=UPI00343D4DC4
MKTNYDNPLRPQFHFTPAANWLNDPNGMVYYEGEYHLFYQHHPESTIWGPMHWGHAVSKDLVHWEHHPIALYPDHNGTVFSGSAIVDWNDTSGFFDGKAGLVAIYTQTEMIPDSDLSKQRQSLAFSKDNGRTWIPYEGNPVLIDERCADFRDPKVFWHEETNRWIMVLAAGDRLFLYHSPDLKDWTFASEFGAQDGSHEGVWECPDLFALPVKDGDDAKKWVMIVSIGDSEKCPEGSRTQYFIGEFDGVSFKNDNPAESVLWLDHGRDNYAGVTWSDAPDLESKRMFIGWMNNWKYANLIPTDDWRGAMTLPRILSLRQDAEGVRLVQTAAAELEQLRLGTREWNDELVEPGNSLLSGLTDGLYELEAEFELDTAEEFGFKIHAGEKHETVVGYEVAGGKLFIDRSNSGIIDFHSDFGCRHEASLRAEDGVIKLQLWVDRSSVEVFADEGGLVITDQLFPLEGSHGMEVFAKGGTVNLRSLRIHPLKSIYVSKATEAVGQ